MASKSKAGTKQKDVGLSTLSDDDLNIMRSNIISRLKKAPFMEHTHKLHKHGRIFTEAPADPEITWKCTEKPRDDHDAPSWLQATEFEDSEAVLMESKVKALAMILKASKETVVYTGAGISASVVGQAAKSGCNKVGLHHNAKAVNPTYTHRALALLHDHGLIQSWQQQNHDGLPQKAGYPQHKLNEIHGSWYDPGNPVVKYNGSLHSLAYQWMVEDAKTADVALVIGTTLSGLNADRVVTDTCERSLRGDALGAVCINLQQTQHDDKMTLRMFGKSDKILQVLLRELDIDDSGIFAAAGTSDARWRDLPSAVLVPYDKDGKRVQNPQKRMWLDLSNRAQVRLSPGYNIQGALQPGMMHIGAAKATKSRTGTTLPPAPGHGYVVQRSEEVCAFKLSIEGTRFTLGLWWLHAAMHGTVPRIPIVNLRPRFEQVREDASQRKQ
eukprot:m.251134 g.251134  ORF g.251134 m.251134 type:complete len:441 (-) comp19534_c0_seq31:124-1446(-)